MKNSFVYYMFILVPMGLIAYLKKKELLTSKWFVIWLFIFIQGGYRLSTVKK